jgi:predicted ribosome quality control (RQC) complex YloA/Tae2 family protein
VLSIAKRISTGKRQEYHSEGDFRDNDHDEDEDESAPITEVRLYIEVMGRLSNIVLVGPDGLILDSIKRITPDINRYRVTLPHKEYIPPPPQEKRDPLRATINTLSLELSKAAGDDLNAPVWKGLVAGFVGVSPTLAREVTFRAFGNAKLPTREVATQPEELTKLLTQLQLLMRGAAPDDKPSVAWRVEAEGGRKPLDFAPYVITHLEGAQAEHTSYESISAAINSFYASLEAMGGHSALKAQVRAEITDALHREERKLSSLREQLRESEALEELRRKGEMVLSYMHTLRPGEQRLVIPGEGLTIELDPALTPVENAQAIFKAYRKAKSAHEGLPELVEATQLIVEYWDGLLTSLDMAATYDDIRAVQAEVRAARAKVGHLPPQEKGKKQKVRDKRKVQEKAPQPLRARTSFGAHLLVGRTAGQNDTATFKLALPDDLWFHARGVPGAHVILRSAGGVTPADIQEAAAMAAAHSKSRSEAQVDVLYTERRYVRKVPNAPPGSATYKNERVVRVAPMAKYEV